MYFYLSEITMLHHILQSSGPLPQPDEVGVDTSPDYEYQPQEERSNVHARGVDETGDYHQSQCACHLYLGAPRTRMLPVEEVLRIIGNVLLRR